jgi:outer membrane receptor protein involved in Fe transport
MDQRYCIPGLSIAECSDNLNTEQIFLRGFDCDGIIQFQEVVAALRLRSIDDRPETEENLLPVKTYTVFDLSAVYQFETVELFVVIENIFNEAWNEAQFETASQLWGESPDIASELQLTAGSPRSVRMGLAYHF